MRIVIIVLLAALLPLPLAGPAAAGETVTYEIDGQPYEGYYAAPGPGAPLVLLVHDWDGLTGYEVQRADMLVHILQKVPLQPERIPVLQLVSYANIRALRQDGLQHRGSGA